MEQYIPYSLLCDLFSKNLETYLHIPNIYMCISVIYITDAPNYVSNMNICFHNKYKTDTANYMSNMNHEIHSN